MSVPADKMEMPRRVPVARPAVQQLGYDPRGSFASQARGQYVPVQSPAPATPINPDAAVGSAQNPVQRVRAATQLGTAPATPPASTPASQVRFGPNPRTPYEMPGTTSTPPAGQPAAAAGRTAGATESAAFRAGQKFAPVARALAPLRSAARALGSTGVGTALYAAGKGAGTTTQEYADRFGVDAPDSVVGDLALRTAGVASDAVAALPDLAIGLGNMSGRFIKAAAPNAPDWLTAQAPTMSDLYDKSAERTRIQRATAANGGVVPAGIALGMGPNGELPQALPEVTAPSAAQMLAGGRQPAASAPAPGQPKAKQPQDQQGAQKPSQSPDDVVGEINGRKITRGESDRLANQNVVPGNAAAQLRAQQPPRDTGPRVFMPRDNGDTQTVEMIDKAISELGPLDRRGRRQALVDLLGLRQRTAGGDLDRASTEQRAAAELAQRTAAEQLSADVDREQIAAQTAQQRRNTQTIADAQGNVYSVEGNTLTPLTKPDGGQLVTGVSKTQAADGYELANTILKQAAEAGTPIDSAAILGAQQAQQQYNFAKNAPAGYRVAQAKDGSLVYVDADGNQIEPE